jgi:predicted kinase
MPARVKKVMPVPHCLILIMGVAGSGKTTLALGILRRICAVYLDNNHIADAFFPDTRNGRRYDTLRPRFYRALYTIAKANLRVGNSVLLDVPHVKEIQIANWRQFVKRMVARTNSRLLVIRCFCSEEVLRSRLLSRGEKRDRQKLSRWKEFSIAQPIHVAVPFRHLDINTEDDLARNTETAIRYIQSALKGRLKRCE